MDNAERGCAGADRPLLAVCGAASLVCVLKRGHLIIDWDIELLINDQMTG
jgi:hypothetical protein